MTSAERLDRTNQAVEILLNHVTISPVRTSSLVDVSFASPSPQLSARLADLWVTQFAQATIDRRFSATLDARKRSEEHTSELQSLMRISYAVFCLKKKKKKHILSNANMQDYDT